MTSKQKSMKRKTELLNKAIVSELENIVADYQCLSGDLFSKDCWNQLDDMSYETVLNVYDNDYRYVFSYHKDKINFTMRIYKLDNNELILSRQYYKVEDSKFNKLKSITKQLSSAIDSGSILLDPFVKKIIPKLAEAVVIYQDSVTPIDKTIKVMQYLMKLFKLNLYSTKVPRDKAINGGFSPKYHEPVIVAGAM